MSQSSEQFLEIRETEALQFFDKGFTKSEIKNMAANAVDKVLENGNPLQVAESLSGMESFIKEVKADDRFKSYTREEVAKYPKGFISASGAKIENAEVGSSYDYKSSCDLIWEGLRLQKEGIEMQIKSREEFLKTIPEGGIIITNENTGETTTIYRPAKSSTSSYKVSLAR